jgi:hypothetical protein
VPRLPTCKEEVQAETNPREVINHKIQIMKLPMLPNMEVKQQEDIMAEGKEVMEHHHHLHQMQGKEAVMEVHHLRVEVMGLLLRVVHLLQEVLDMEIKEEIITLLHLNHHTKEVLQEKTAVQEDMGLPHLHMVKEQEATDMELPHHQEAEVDMEQRTMQQLNLKMTTK